MTKQGQDVFGCIPDRWIHARLEDRLEPRFTSSSRIDRSMPLPEPVWTVGDGRGCVESSCSPSTLIPSTILDAILMIERISAGRCQSLRGQRLRRLCGPKEAGPHACATRPENERESRGNQQLPREHVSSCCCVAVFCERWRTSVFSIPGTKRSVADS